MSEALKQLIKDAILEALTEFANSDVVAIEEEAPGTQNNEDESGKGGNSANNSGGTPNNGRPKPDVGVGVHSLR